MKIPKAKKLPSGSWNIYMMVAGERISITAPTKKEAEQQAAAVKAGLKNYTAGGSTPNAFAADDAGREAFSAFAQPAPLCSCAGCAHGTAADGDAVSGFGAPRFQYFTQKDISMIYYNDILRIRDLLRGKVASASGETRMHYQYLLHNLDKALNK